MSAAIGSFKRRCTVNVLRIDYEVVMGSLKLAGMSYSRVVAMITSAMACHFRQAGDLSPQEVRGVVDRVIDAIHREHVCDG